VRRQDLTGELEEDLKNLNRYRLFHVDETQVRDSSSAVACFAPDHCTNLGGEGRPSANFLCSIVLIEPFCKSVLQEQPGKVAIKKPGIVLLAIQGYRKATVGGRTLVLERDAKRDGECREGHGSGRFTGMAI